MRASCLQSRRLCIGSRHCGHELSLRSVVSVFTYHLSLVSYRLCGLFWSMHMHRPNALYVCRAHCENAKHMACGASADRALSEIRPTYP